MGHGTCRVSTCTTLRIRTSLNFMPKAPHIPPLCPGLGRKSQLLSVESRKVSQSRQF